MLKSSDYGSHLPAKVYHPEPLADGEVTVGRGDTLVVLHEARALRMSHYQLIRLGGAQPGKR